MEKEKKKNCWPLAAERPATAMFVVVVVVVVVVFCP